MKGMHSLATQLFMSVIFLRNSLLAFPTELSYNHCMKKRSIALVLFVGYCLLLGAFVGIFGMKFLFSPSTPSQSSDTSTPSLFEYTYFQRHSVAVGNYFARIPVTSASPFSDYSNAVGPYRQRIDGPFLEVNLATDRLPVEKIESAVTDFRKIVYTVDINRYTEDRCPFPELFEYDLATKQTRAIKADERLWTCGAARSYLHTLSPGGRYAIFLSEGGSEAGGVFYYDLQAEQLDTALNASSLVVFISSPDPQLDTLTLFLDACAAEDGPLSENCEETGVLAIRDNQSGTTTRLKTVEKKIKAKGLSFSSMISYSSSYSLENDTLTLGNGTPEGFVIIPHFLELVSKERGS